MGWGRFSLSLSQQWLLIAVVTMVPMLTMISYATWSFYQQMQVQKDVVATSDRIAEVQSAASERARELERSARQYRLLQDPGFLDSVEEKHTGLRTSLAALIREQALLEQNFPGGVGEKQQVPLQRAIDELQQLLARIDSVTITRLDDEAFAQFIAQLGQFRSEFSAAVSEQLQQMSDYGETQLQSILWNLSLMGAITLPLTLAFMGLGFAQMIRPIRRLSNSIIHLGHGQWQKPISVAGPRDLQALGERLEWMRGELLQAEQQKQQFLRHVSHELKTPLAAIMEAGSLLADEVPGSMNARQHKVLKILLANSQNLQELIQQLLNYNVLIHNVSINEAELDLAALCHKVADRLDQQSFRHAVRWRIDGQPQWVRLDPQLMEMIMSNLLSNAYHYSPTGAWVEVSWQLEQAESQTSQGWLRVSVVDQGPGIAPEETEKIFEPFTQGSVRRHGSIHGSGVGLTIVSESIKRMGGTIELQSQPGEGSCFTIRVPLAPVSREGIE